MIMALHGRQNWGSMVQGFDNGRAGHALGPRQIKAYLASFASIGSEMPHLLPAWLPAEYVLMA